MTVFVAYLNTTKRRCRFVQHLGGQSFYISEEQFVEHFPWPYIYQFDQEGINKEYPWKVFNKNLEASKKT